MRQTETMPRRLVVRAVAVLTAGLMLGATACASTEPAPQPSPKDITPAGTVIVTAGSTNETNLVVPDPIKASWTTLGSKGKGVDVVEVAGDGQATSKPYDFSGDAAAQITQFTEQLNGVQAQAPGRSALAGLDQVKTGTDPVWVFSPLLDTVEPLDFNQLAFDESPGTVVKAVQKAGKLPKLKGREVVFVVTPVAGEQGKLSALQTGYQRAVWEGLVKAAGAKKVTFYVGTGTTAGTGTIPAIPIPDPNAKINSEKKGSVSTCTLPSPALFVSDQAALIDKKATLKALQECLGDLSKTTKITVEGHTAGVSGSDNAFAKSLSTRRATEVAALLRELKVPAGNIEKVVGYGSSKPIKQPSSDPGNRAVVVTFTTSS